MTTVCCCNQNTPQFGAFGQLWVGEVYFTLEFQQTVNPAAKPGRQEFKAMVYITSTRAERNECIFIILLAFSTPTQSRNHNQ